MGEIAAAFIGGVAGSAVTYFIAYFQGRRHGYWRGKAGL